MSQFLPCPRCSGIPEWYNRPMLNYALRTSQKRGYRCDIISGCRHVGELFRESLIEINDQPAAVTRWNAEAERMFAEVTVRLTDQERASFRARLFAGHKGHDTMPAPAPAILVAA